MPDITIAGATFRNVPQIDVPKDGGGSASFVYEEGTKQISTNGTHDVSGYLNAQVSVPSQSPVINPLSVTENGTYTAPSGVDGYSPVTVNVSGGGGENFQALWVSGNRSGAGLAQLIGPLTVAKTGTYTVRWVMSRNNNNNDTCTALFINGSKYGDVISFAEPNADSERVFNRLLLATIKDVTLNKDDVLAVHGGYTTSQVATTYAANLVIEEQTA